MVVVVVVGHLNGKGRTGRGTWLSVLQGLDRGGHPDCSLAGRSLHSLRLLYRRRVTHAIACGRPHVSLCVSVCVVAGASPAS